MVVPNWKEILDRVQQSGSTYDIVRREYLGALHRHTGRNVIIYYSGWLQKGELARQGFDFGINDADKNGFMTCIHHLDRTLGLDLLLHTPGGEMAATESLVDYLRSMFGRNIRAFVPQIAMSGGTMIACACDRIVMGKESSIGPIDPQFMGLPAHGIIEEFERAKREIAENAANIPVWQPIIAKYAPTMIGECEKAIKWANQLAREWLVSGMFAAETDITRQTELVQRVVSELGDHALTLSHSRHISLQAARDMGLTVDALEDDNDLQDAVLSVHHAAIQTLSATPAVKIIENHNGVSYINNARPSAQ